LVEEFDVKLLQARGDDPMNKSFQVSADSTEPKMVKVRKYDGCDHRRMRELPLYIAVGNGEFKENCKRLQLRHV
jgi:hypothetical protein